MKVDKRGYLYLGKKFADQDFHLSVGNDGNVLHLERVLTIPAKNAWFFDPEWQDAEARAQDDIDKGKVKEVKDVKGFLSKYKK
jgi:hypothetical protein